MGWRIEIGGVEVKGDTPDQTIKDAAEAIQVTAVTVAEAIATGNPEKIKEAVGELVLNNNLSTLGARHAAEHIFPKLNDNQFERIIGAGVLTMLGTGDVTLTVIATAEQFYAEYSMVANEHTQPPSVPPAGSHARSPKSYTVECYSLTKWHKESGDIELWAGFNKDPVFVDAAGKQYTWPVVDIKKGDVVRIKGEASDISKDISPKSYQVLDASGLYKMPSSDTPGLGPNQITQTLIFDYVETS